MPGIGDEVRKTLTMESEEKGERPVFTGTVVYVHPEGRFYVAEFRLPGGTVRESFRG